MFTWMKYLPAVIKLQDVSAAYQEETGKTRHPLLSRRVLGTLLGTAAIVGGIYGVDFDPTQISTATDAVKTIVDSIIAIWSAVMVVVGILKAETKLWSMLLGIFKKDPGRIGKKFG